MIELRRAGAGDLGSVVRIHRQAFAGFFLTRLGPVFLAKYYRLVLAHPGGILLVAVHEGQIAGFAAGVASPAAFYREMKKRKLSFALAVIPAWLRSPGILRRLWVDFRDLRSRAGPAGGESDGTAELTSIGVAPAGSGQGIGRGLLAAFIAEAGKMGLAAITLTTDAEGNDAVNGFYLQAGFRLQRTFTQGDGRRMNEYRKDIA